MTALTEVSMTNFVRRSARVVDVGGAELGRASPFSI